MKSVTGRSSNLNINKRQPPYDNHPLSARLQHSSWSQCLAPEGYKQALEIIIIIHNRTCSIIQEHCSRLIYFLCLPPPPKGLNPQSEWVAVISCGALSYLPYRRHSHHHHHNNTHTRPGLGNSFLDRSGMIMMMAEQTFDQPVMECIALQDGQRVGIVLPPVSIQSYL